MKIPEAAALQLAKTSTPVGRPLPSSAGPPAPLCSLSPSLPGAGARLSSCRPGREGADRAKLLPDASSPHRDTLPPPQGSLQPRPFRHPASPSPPPPLPPAHPAAPGRPSAGPAHQRCSAAAAAHRRAPRTPPPLRPPRRRQPPPPPCPALPLARPRQRGGARRQLPAAIGLQCLCAGPGHASRPLLSRWLKRKVSFRRASSEGVRQPAHTHGEPQDGARWKRKSMREVTARLRALPQASSA